MNDKFHTTIEFQEFLPVEIVHQLIRDLHLTPKDVKEIKIRPQAHVEHFDQAIPAAIKLFIEHHKIGVEDGLIASVVFKAAEIAYSALKALGKHFLSKMEIIYKVGEKKAVFTIDNVASDDKPIEKVAQIIESGKVILDFNNPELQKYSGVSETNYYFDEKSKLLLPFNYKEQRKNALDKASEFDH